MGDDNCSTFFGNEARNEASNAAVYRGARRCCRRALSYEYCREAHAYKGGDPSLFNDPSL